MKVKSHLKPYALVLDSHYYPDTKVSPTESTDKTEQRSEVGIRGW
jgi:hypothetical protein